MPIIMLTRVDDLREQAASVEKHPDLEAIVCTGKDLAKIEADRIGRYPLVDDRYRAFYPFRSRIARRSFTAIGREGDGTRRLTEPRPLPSRRETCCQNLLSYHNLLSFRFDL